MSHKCSAYDCTYEKTSVVCGVCGRTWEWIRRNGYMRWWVTNWGTA